MDFFKDLIQRPKLLIELRPFSYTRQTMTKNQLFTALLLPISATITAQKASEKVNIIYILADDLGYGDISALNPQSKIQTPNIDRLANSGIKFTDAHSSSSVSTPSRYSILTGRYSWRSTLQNGVLWSYSPPLIDTSRLTVATLLQENGYNTACIGKWHLGLGWQRFAAGENDIDFTKPLTISPNDHGFGYSYIMSASLDIPPYVYIENHNFTAPVNDTLDGQGGVGFFRRGPLAEGFDIYSTLDHFTDKAVEYITEQADQERPFFLYFPLTAPHTPVLPSEKFRGKSTISPYADFVLHVDDVVGRVVKAVQEAGIEGRTMVIFASDNGFAPMADMAAQQQHGHSPSGIYRGHKADIYDGGHRVPYIVSCPAIITQPKEVASTVCYANLMATCAEILGVELPDNAAEDSFSMLPILQGKKGKGRVEPLVHHSIDGNFSIRSGRWKLNLCPGSGGWSTPVVGKEASDAPPMQLFDMNTNPQEASSGNLYHKYPSKVKRLLRMMDRAIADGRTTQGVKQSNDTKIDLLKQK